MMRSKATKYRKFYNKLKSSTSGAKDMFNSCSGTMLRSVSSSKYFGRSTSGKWNV